MAKPWTTFLAEHPVDREQVEKHKRRMLAEVRAYVLGDRRVQVA